MMAGVVTNFTAPVAHAQADVGSVVGIVTDATGAVVPNAQVKVTNAATGAVHTTVTNGKGEYSVTQLLPATYSLTVTAQGFAPAKKDVSVTVGSRDTANVKLAVSGGVTVVNVAADDFAGVQLEKAEVSAVIETNQILSLPTRVHKDHEPHDLVVLENGAGGRSGRAAEHEQGGRPGHPEEIPLVERPPPEEGEDGHHVPSKQEVFQHVGVRDEAQERGSAAARSRVQRGDGGEHKGDHRDKKHEKQVPRPVPPR